MRLPVSCPICGESVTLTLEVRPRLSHGENGRKGFLTAEASASGIEHTCSEKRVVQYLGSNADRWLSFLDESEWHTNSEGQLIVFTKLGEIVATPGDWLIRGPNGGLYVAASKEAHG